MRSVGPRASFRADQQHHIHSENRWLDRLRVQHLPTPRGGARSEAQSRAASSKSHRARPEGKPCRSCSVEGRPGLALLAPCTTPRPIRQRCRQGHGSRAAWLRRDAHRPYRAPHRPRHMAPIRGPTRRVGRRPPYPPRGSAEVERHRPQPATRLRLGASRREPRNTRAPFRTRHHRPLARDLFRRRQRHGERADCAMKRTRTHVRPRPRTGRSQRRPLRPREHRHALPPPNQTGLR